MKDNVLNATMWIVTACTYISYIPQLAKLIKTKKSDDIAISSWVIWAVSSAAGVIYSLVLGRIEMIVSECSSFCFIIATLILTFKYSSKKSYNVE